MIILDTNVVSALMRPDMAESVPRWLNGARDERVCTTVVTIMEVHYGIEKMPTGRKRRDLMAAFADLRAGYLADALPFDVPAALLTAEILADAHAVGRNLDYPDTQIAGIALSNNATLATRNIKDFEGLGLRLVNPWD